MVDGGFAHTIKLRYNSNGIDLPEELFELWDHFKEVRFNISIDSIKERNNYIRYPSKWTDIEDSLAKLDNTKDHITVNIATAVQLLNVLDLSELAQWKLDKKYKKINIENKTGGVITMHLVTYPSYLNICVLPLEMKKLAASRILEFVNKYNTPEFVQSKYGKQRWEALISYMMKEDLSHKLPSTIEYLEICDNTRNSNFREIFKDLKL